MNHRDKEKKTALQLAASKGHLPIVKVLFDAGADINSQDIYGISPLMWVVEEAKIEVISFLVEHGADLNLQRANGLTALMSTWAGGREKAVEILLEAGADTKIKNDEGMTALDCIRKWSNSSRYVEAVEKIFKHYGV